MPISRIMPGIVTKDVPATRSFYCNLIGLEVGMEDSPDFFSLDSPDEPAAQLIVNDNGHAGLPPGIFIDVGNLERLRHIHRLSLDAGVKMIAPFETKPWGIVRFSILDPNGICVTLIAHAEQ